MPNPFKAHRDSIAGRIERRQLKDSIRRLRELADHPEEDDGPNWLDITLDSSEEEVEAALQAEVERSRPVLDPFAAPLRPPGAITSCPLDRSWRRWDMFNTPKYLGRAGRQTADHRRGVRGETVESLGLGPARLGAGVRRRCVRPDDERRVRPARLEVLGGLA